MLGLGVPQWQRLRDTKIAQRRERLSIGESIVSGTWITATTSPSESTESLSTTLSAAPVVLPVPRLAGAIITSSVPELVDGIKTRRWTATQVLLVYIKQTLAVNSRTNAVTEPMFEEALAMARQLDEDFERTGEIVGPLHGVPCSIKDQFDIAGFDSTIGSTQDVGKPASVDGFVAATIKAAGGIPFVKTNVPQTMLSFECGNPLGTSSNPYDASRTPGGSSGGEGALIGADASPLGFGSDIGGSLRIPAAYSGCFGIKVSGGRVAGNGAVSSNAGFEAVVSCFGSMGRSVDDLEASVRILVDGSAKLSRTLGLLPLPYRNEVELPKKLKVGYYLTDGFCRASPACRRAVLETVAAMEKRGHECVEFAPPSPIEGAECFVALTSAGGYETLLSALRGDPIEPSLFLATLGPKLPWIIRVLASFLLRNVVGDGLMSRLIDASHYKTVTETQAWQKKRQDYVRNFRETVWGTMELDMILCAVQATPALKIGQTKNLSPLAIGTFLYNIVESAVGCVPVTFVDPVKDALDVTFMSEGLAGSKLVEGVVYGAKGKKGVYDSWEMAGLPVGVQVVGAQYEEEKVIKMMRERALVAYALVSHQFNGPATDLLYVSPELVLLPATLRRLGETLQQHPALAAKVQHLAVRRIKKGAWISKMRAAKLEELEMNPAALAAMHARIQATWEEDESDAGESTGSLDDDDDDAVASDSATSGRFLYFDSEEETMPGFDLKYDTREEVDKVAKAEWKVVGNEAWRATKESSSSAPALA
ncbi:hypothetical protein RQP46_001121 [Phenoliferia psychrophenolica]